MPTYAVALIRVLLSLRTKYLGYTRASATDHYTAAVWVLANSQHVYYVRVALEIGSYICGRPSPLKRRHVDGVYQSAKENVPTKTYDIINYNIMRLGNKLL